MGNEVDVLLGRTDLNREDRRIRSRAGVGDRALPDLFASGLIQAHHRLLVAARSDDDAVAVDERRFGVAPSAVRAPEIFAEILAPFHLAVGDIHAGEVAARA